MMHHELPHKTILVFGPQPLAFDQESFRELRESIVDSLMLEWIHDVISELPKQFDTVCDSFPQLHVVPGALLLEALGEWLSTGTLTGISAPPNMPNIVLTPLCVIAQLVAYTRYAEKGQLIPNPGVWNSDHKDCSSNTETVGFCTGLVAALVVSLGGTREDFEKNGAIAVRLAMLIGAVVDAQDVTGVGSGSLSAVWRTPEGLTTVNKLLEEYPDAYISVRYDENRVTVTAPRVNLSEFIKKAGSVGLTALEIGLSGQFHSKCHQTMLAPLQDFCEANAAFQFPEAPDLRYPCIVDVTHTGDKITTGRLSSLALEALLVRKSEWWETFASLCTSSEQNTTVITIGPERCTPPSIAHSPPACIQLIHLADVPVQSDKAASRPLPDNPNDIVVIGMACKVAGADDIEELWDILRKGQSQHSEVSKTRFSFETAFRDHDPRKKWYGNFIKDYDSFDHKFFKKTPREAASMDPQQRLLLEVAYQAVQQSGYFQKPTVSLDVGCYVGTCAVDYEYNVACHAPNAFSSTGNLRGFIAGKVSHYFGWTGPGLTLDTACSGAAVAVHQACKAILGGECESALAAGVNMITQPLAYQNLAAASFLSQSGQCKPFCATADGYCRGEGVAAVFLKKKSAALADGDQIFGVISSTAVNQNQNCTPIFVPNAPSLSGLFENVLRRAQLDPQDISYVEAHGTGTPVGDPAEYESIRQVFAVPRRPQPVQLGSIKGLVGHTESASGLVSLIKVLLMMHHGAIPPQPSFQKLNPQIKAHNSVQISTCLRSWKDPFKAALINNYGASGSNASMVVRNTPVHPRAICGTAGNSKYPFWLSASDDKSLHACAQKLRLFVGSRSRDTKWDTIQALSFNMFRQSNWRLGKALFLGCSTLEELRENLSGDWTSSDRPPTPPVILCFGGQISTFVGLDRGIVEKTTVLAHYLDRCDTASTSLGFGSIYPEIFQRTPIQDIVKLQLCLFSLQYASAKSWLDCGVHVSALVGHSFGELTALCVSNCLGLHDTINLIAGRARIVRDEWGAEKGAMMAVEADLDQVEALVQASMLDRYPVTIACFNGPRSFTLAGTSQSIHEAAQKISRDSAYSSISAKKLNVTNAFHSTLVEHLMPRVEHMARYLGFGKQSIPVEFATKEECREELRPRYVADHMRNPVYFDHAVQRLSERYPSSVWLEAGSSSTVTSMASRALAGTKANAHVFCPVNITTDSATTNLTSTTLNLWKAGVNATFWQHHSSQMSEYPAMLLPPYQFEKSKHWMELRVSSNPQEATAAPVRENGFWRFEKYQDTEHHSIRFRVLTESEQYKEMVSSHFIAQTAPICPATLEVEIAIEAFMSLHPEFERDNFQPRIEYVENHAPICFDSSRVVWLDLTAMNPGASPSREWAWNIISENTLKPTPETVHATGQIVFCHVDDSQFQMEFARYERLVSHQRCVDLLYGNAADDDIAQGPSIYRMFDEVVQYGERYQGLKRLVGRASRNESAGRVVQRYTGTTWLDAYLSDSFSQVGGIWVNCMSGRGHGDMYIANGFEKWVRSPKLRKNDPRPETWDVFACHEKHEGNAFLTDIFIFDPRRGTLAEVILGINFAKVSKLSMSKLLSRLTMNDKAIPSLDSGDGSTATSHKPTDVAANGTTGKKASRIPKTDVHAKIRLILADLSGLDAGEVQDDSYLADLGIDSLMGMELAREIEGAFDCSLATDALMEVFSFQGLIQCVRQTLGLDPSYECVDGIVSPTSSDDTLGEDTLDTSIKNTSCETTNSEFSSIEIGLQVPINAVDSNPSIEIPEHDLKLPSSVVLAAFLECKAMTDHFIELHKCQHYFDSVMPMQTKLCVSLTLEAFAKLGSDLRLARPGQEVERISHIPPLERLVDYLYEMLEKESRIIKIDRARIIRTAVAAPTETSSELLHAVIQAAPEHRYPHNLTYFAGSKLADVLCGKSNGIKIIFGTEEGRQLASGLYADSPLNRLSYEQMEDFVKRLVSNLPTDMGALKVLELGAGTGGTTKWIAPLLAGLEIPVEYTFSDLSPSFVGAARKRFGKQYSFMQFRTVDVEEEPHEELLNSYHMVLASNAIHATHSLTRSLSNIRKMLRPDGFTMMLEMTRPIYWVDMIFGLLEGWWLFDDGRRHAIAHESRWEQDLYSAGYSHVDWSDGNHPETAIQRVFLALKGDGKDPNRPTAEIATRQAMVDAYVQKYTQDFSIPNSPRISFPTNDEVCILVTGATGSLGSHIAGYLSQLPQVKSIICLNRRSTMDPHMRQIQALEARGITTANISKLKIIETDTTKPMLGLDKVFYDSIVAKVTHIVHNAWPMSGKRPLKGFEAQFKFMRNMLDITSAASGQGSNVVFQFISSIAVVGHHPIITGEPLVPERRIDTAAAVLPNGYGDAKWACELMLDETLHLYPESFRTMTVRLGQVAGSKTSGYWNHMEHLTFMLQSSQTLGAFPNLEGVMSWTPVNDVAATLCDILLHNSSASYPIYHIDNPVRQPWSEMVPVLAKAIGAEVVSFREWVHKVRSYTGSVESENPAAKLVDFFDQDYTRMSCGGLLLDTTRACEHSRTMRAVGPVNPDVVRKYVESWKLAGVLKA